MQNKKAMSVMIAYIILISIALAISPFVYKYLKTYIEGQDTPECPSEISLFIKKLNRTYTSEGTIVNITFKNTGLFNIGGYLIKTSDNIDTVATKDISRYVLDETRLDPGVNFKLNSKNINSFSPGQETTHFFDIPTRVNITKIEITPLIWSKENKKSQLAICDNSKITEIIDTGTGFG